MIFTVTLNPAVDRELTVPAIEMDAVLRASSWRVDCGGKGFNVSRMLNALGTESTALGFAGGRSGELLRDGLTDLGIATDFVWVSGETRTNVSIVSQNQGHYVKVNEPGPTIQEKEVDRLLKKISEQAGPGQWWVLAGSLPPGVTSDIYKQMIASLHESGANAILDASGAALSEGCQASPFLVKPNEFEAHTLTGLPVQNDAEIIAAARVIQAIGAENVVVSMGKAGAILVDDRHAWLASTPKIEEKNPIGAGDSLVGGLVWGLSRGEPLSAALRWGLACGAATASMEGTGVGSKSLVTSLFEKVEIKQIKPLPANGA